MWGIVLPHPADESRAKTKLSFAYDTVGGVSAAAAAVSGYNAGAGLLPPGTLLLYDVVVFIFHTHTHTVQGKKS